MPFRESLACGLQKCVGNLWKGDDYSDFNIIVDDTSFKCHRFILSACSVFFQGMLKSPMKEQIEGHAKLEGMTVSTFEIIINVLYTGVEELSNDNVLDVWSASEMLQIDYLTKQCHTFVMENISVDTCFRFLNHATLYDAQTVVDYCLDFISRNFDTFMNEDRLLQLPFDQFHKVIENDYLATDCEDLVVEAILNWVKYGTRSAPSTSLDSGSDIGEINDEMSDGDASTNILSNSGSEMYTHDDQANVLSNVITDSTNTGSQIMDTRVTVDAHTVVPVQSINVSKCSTTDETEVENRKQHLAQLLSACRLFTVKSNWYSDCDWYRYDRNKLYSFSYAHGHALEWSNCGELGDNGNCLSRFQKYILVFCTQKSLINVHCYNIKTAKTHKCTTSMRGTSEDMVSFTHREDVYILQRNGTLWKVFSTDTTPVDFELVCKLWDFDCGLKGCVLYRKSLFIFCNSKPPEPTLTSFPEFFTSIQIININSTQSCLPMTLKLS